MIGMNETKLRDYYDPIISLRVPRLLLDNLKSTMKRTGLCQSEIIRRGLKRELSSLDPHVGGKTNEGV